MKSTLSLPPIDKSLAIDCEIHHELREAIFEPLTPAWVSTEDACVPIKTNYVTYRNIYVPIATEEMRRCRVRGWK